METKLFHGDIEAVEIPDGGLELAPEIMLVDVSCGRSIEFEHRIDGSYVTTDEPLFQSLRTLFLRKPSEYEE